MDEKKEIKKQLIKNMLINFIIYTIILFIFDLVIYNQVVFFLYKDIDKQLENSIYEIGSEKRPIRPDNSFAKNPTMPEEKRDINPRLIKIERDSNGKIQNEDELGNLERYINEIKFSDSNLYNIYKIQIGGKYNYRVINYETTKNNEKVYIQILANVDGEEGTLENLLNILIIGTAILVIIFIVVSYILSKRAMKPIISAYKKQTEFVQNASHELRTPLTIIQAKQEMLLTQPDKKIIEKSEEINLTLKETRRLTKLIKELMELARADDNNNKIEKEETNINKLIEEVAAPYIDMAAMQEKTIEFDFKYNKIIKLNKSKINELFIILLDNAIKYTNKEDKIIIKTYEKDVKCNIEVIDTGIGISNNAIGHVFERFYREDKARSRQTGGNGLGLAIAKTIVNMHNGTIKAIHNKPKGTIIKIRI